jgi:hypothetical protein
LVAELAPIADAGADDPGICAYKINTDPLKDLIPVIQLSRQPLVLAVHPALGVNSLAELVVLAKQQSGMSYGIAGGINASYMAVEWFARSARVSFEPVQYRGGGPMVLDLIAGHVKSSGRRSTLEPDRGRRWKPVVAGSRYQAPGSRAPARCVGPPSRWPRSLALP